MAERYGLPFPPKDAPLVLASTGRTTLAGNSSTSHDPGLYRPAFLLKKESERETRVLMGGEERVAFGDAEHRPPTRPFSLGQPEPRLTGYVLDVARMSTFVSVIQLAHRGSTEDARRLWALIERAEYFFDGDALEGLGELRAIPARLLARCLYQHFYAATLRHDADLKDIHAKLETLKGEFPDLFAGGFHQDRRGLFIRDLARVVTAKPAAPGSIEALLLVWEDRPDPCGAGGYWHHHSDDDPPHPALAIFRRGLDALTELSALASDQRVTRHIDQAIMKKPEDRFRLGTLASRLLGERPWSEACRPRTRPQGSCVVPRLLPSRVSPSGPDGSGLRVRPGSGRRQVRPVLVPCPAQGGPLRR